MAPRSRTTASSLIAAGLLALAAPEASGQTGSESNVGYIDSAVPTNQVRLRFDSADGVNRPDRAAWFWPAAGGPAKAESNVAFQNLIAMFEVKVADHVSTFAEVPARFLNPEQNPNAVGFSDLRFGLKAALIDEPDRVVTFQFRTYVPTGQPSAGLGTGHASLEPSLLFLKNLTESLTLEGQVGDWIPVGGGPFAGNVVDYGLGLSYQFEPAFGWRISPVVEVIGWTVLNGQESTFPTDAPIPSAGKTIVNAKAGVRFALASHDAGGLLGNSDVYVGYGRALTGDVWYKDIFRVELRLRF